jgi:N-methylhydantoinase A
LRALADEAVALVEKDGIPRARIHLDYEADMRIHGQIWEISVPLPRVPLGAESGNHEIYETFKTEYARKYGDGMVGDLEQCDILNLRVIARGAKPKPKLIAFEQANGANAAAAIKGQREIFSPQDGLSLVVDVVDGARVKAGMTFQGPVIIERKNTTIFVTSNARAEFDSYHNCLMQFV